jgi:hypothetical protein
MKKENINDVFEKLYERYYTAKERTYKNRLQKAKDKDFVFEELKKEIEFVLEMLQAKEKKKLVEVFESHYKRGEAINYIFKLLQKSFGTNEDMASFTMKDEEGNETTVYEREEEKALRKLASSERALTKFFVRYLVHKEMKINLPRIFDEFSQKEIKSQPLLGYEIKWTSNKVNKNDFVQIIYALHKAGKINNGKGEITKIVETLAEVFNIKLGENWQGNHSKSIHKRKKTYEVPIFTEIESAYKQYEAELIENKRNKK